MAPGLRSWSLVLVAGCAVTALAAFPVRTFDASSGAELTPERREARRLGMEARVAVEQLRRMTWLEEGRAALERAASRGEALSVEVGSDSRLDPTALRRSVEGELSRIGAARPAAALGVFEVDRRTGVDAASLGLEPRFTELYNASHSEWYAGVEAGRPWCIALRVTGLEVRDDPSRDWRGSNPEHSNILGPCAFYARFGAPGRGLEEWLAATGGAFALRRAESFDLPMPNVLPRPGLFGTFRYSVAGAERIASVAACARGRIEACDALVTGRDRRDEGPGLLQLRREGIPLVAARLGGISGNPFSATGEQLLARIEREFGPIAFERFWRSDRPVAEAFEAAFGLPLGEWVRDWARELFPNEGTEAAVAPRRGVVGLLLVWLALAAAYAVAKARSRTVG